MTRAIRMTGGVSAHRARLEALSASPKRPHRPTRLPLPDGAILRQRAADARREAAGILRHVPAGVDDLHTRFAHRLADELCAEADRLEAQATAQEVAQNHAMSPSDSPL